MSEGRLVLVLHGHLPYVLHHGVWPHGESWLFEGAAETYLPLLELLDELADRGTRFGLTVGLTPVLLEQLASDHFKARFVDYLHERADRARHDAAEFDRTADPRAPLARQWEAFYADRLSAFDRLDRDLPAAFARHWHDGRIELLSSAATHAYLPLLSRDESVAAQLRAGLATSGRHLGRRPRGLWLPECAYRPAEPAWVPPFSAGPPVARPGLESPLAAVGVDHTFVDTHLVAHARPLAVVAADGSVDPTSDAMIYWDARRGWGSPLEILGMGESAARAGVFALARHPRVAEQVWSAVHGYPGADNYLEFHRKHGDHGLRYHRITSHHTPAHEKQPYDPARTAGVAYAQAQHFCGVLRDTLAEHARRTGRTGTVVAPFDAELFGHWWFEGLAFLRDVLLTLSHDGTVDVVTAEAAVAAAPLDKVARLPEGSWGEGGGHHVWLNDQTRWLWESAGRAEDRFLRLRAELPWRTRPDVADLLRAAGRELLLLQASDWPFVIHSQSAADYGIGRFAGHATRFDRLCSIATAVAAGRPIDSVRATEVAEAAAHDVAFADVDLDWWA